MREISPDPVINKCKRARQCIRDTEGMWKDFLEHKKEQEEIEAKAERVLIEEAKERLRRKKSTEIMRTNSEIQNG